MKLALHRSITFWSGILVMAFICWAWRDSRDWYSRLAKGGVVVTSMQGGLSIHRADKIRHSFVERSANQLSPKFKWFPSAFFVSENDALKLLETYIPANIPDTVNLRERQTMMMARIARPGDWLLFLPHWLILLVVAVSWSVLLFWRAKWRCRDKRCAAC